MLNRIVRSIFEPAQERDRDIDVLENFLSLKSVNIGRSRLLDWQNILAGDGDNVIILTMKILNLCGADGSAMMVDLEDAAQVEGLILPALVYLDEGKLAILSAVDSQGFHFECGNGRIEMVAPHELEEFWSGIYIHTEISEGSDFRTGRISSQFSLTFWLDENRALLIASGTAIIFAISLGFQGFAHAQEGGLLPFIMAMGVASAGLLLSALLVKFHFTGEAKALNKLCQTGGDVVSTCAEMISGPDGKIYGVPYADLGFVYFATVIIALLAYGIASPALLILYVIGAVISIAAFGYQFFVLGKICRLCVLIQTLALSLTGIGLSQGVTYGLALPVNISGLGVMTWQGAAMLLPTLLWAIIRPELGQRALHERKSREFDALIARPEVINGILASAPSFSVTPVHTAAKTGVEHAPTSLVTVVSSSCPSCAKVIDNILELLPVCGRELSIELRLWTYKPEAGEPAYTFEAYQASSYILAIIVEHGLEAGVRALKSWLEAENGRDFQAWKAAQVKVAPLSLVDAEQNLEEVASWCDEQGLQFTPTILWNDRKLPSFLNYDFAGPAIRRAADMYLQSAPQEGGNGDVPLER